jgi:AcrR family transcriptional regulator
MSMGTVDWMTAGSPESAPAEGLRERKKRLMRQQLSDTATRMFLERGFDAVRVAEVAEACGVSEKTVFNYFPTKESLILDRFETTISGLRAGLAEPGIAPVEAALQTLEAELGAMISWLAGQQDTAQAVAGVARFVDLIESTPSLRAYQHEMADQLVAMAAEALAARAGLDADDPEPQIAATALIGLWRVQSRVLRKHLDAAPALAQLQETVTAEVRRAARLIDVGLRSFARTAAEAPPAAPGR